MKLKQGDMFVREYQQRFTNLSKYAPDVVSDKRRHCHQF